MKLNNYEAPSMKIIHICEEDIICTSNIAPHFVQGTGTTATSAGQANFNTLWGN